MALTKRQREVYDFLSRFVDKHGYSPSFEEIGSGLKLNSLATVHKHLTNLERKGLLKRDYNKSRSIDVIPERRARARMTEMAASAAAAAVTQRTAAAAVEFPLLGRIAAGRPVETFEQPETISLNDVTRSKDVFVLQVMGDSMQDEHIVDGDYVMVEKVKVARNGEIVVALVDGSDTTLKRFYKEGDRIRLQPSNISMKPIMLPAAAVQIQGRVIGVLRKY
jgi:repressor LexA